MKKKEVLELPLDQVELPEKELRTIATQEGLETLADSIRKIGVLQPITVERKRNKYIVIAGTRRTLAAKQAGLATIPAIVVKMSQIQKEVATLHENLIREDVNHLDIARYIKTMMEENNLTQEEIARFLGYTQPWVSAHLRLLRIPEELQAAVEANQIDYQSALQLSRIKNEKRRRSLLNFAIKDGATLETVRRWVQDELGLQNRIPTQSGALDKVSEKNIPPPPTFTCFLCGEEHPSDDMILVRLGSECYSTLKKALKLEKEGKIG